MIRACGLCHELARLSLEVPKSREFSDEFACACSVPVVGSGPWRRQVKWELFVYAKIGSAHEMDGITRRRLGAGNRWKMIHLSTVLG